MKRVNKSLMNIEQKLKSSAELIQDTLLNHIHQLINTPEPLKKAMSYSLSAGGKRIRPFLVLEVAKAVSGDEAIIDKALYAACAIEYIHTYSLIHDDLPAMDNDDYRRGKLTNHKVFGEALAILAGDALLTQAFGLLSQMAKQNLIEPKIAIELIDDLVHFAGAQGMVGGQVADIEAEQGDTTFEQLQFIQQHKTSDLIICSVLAGGRIAEANETQLKHLYTFARNIGLAFQIQDDILDVIGDEVKLGKATNSDVNNEKVTYPYFIGLEESKQLVIKLTDEAKSAIEFAQLKDASTLIALADYLVHREY